MRAAGNTCRFLYNYFLKVNQDEYQKTKKFVWYSQMCAQLPELKKDNPWLGETYSQVLQQSLRDLDTALRNMRKTGSGFPNFKSKYTTPISFRYQQNTRLGPGVLHLPKIGDIRIKLHRALPSADYTGCTIMETARGWYASFVVEVAEPQLVSVPTNPVGLDVNSQFLGLSTGELIRNPKPLKNKFIKIKNLQRNLARKQKGSKNRQKTKTKLARAHDQVRCQRANHVHQVSGRIAKVHDLVCCETLKLDQMRRASRPAAKAIADAGWGLLFSALEYKCQKNGNHFLKISQWLPSSKKCSACGTEKQSLSLTQREFNCEACGLAMHRDLNAAVNIRNWGLQQWEVINQSGQELPKAPVDVLFDILVYSGTIDSTQMKQEAAFL